MKLAHDFNDFPEMMTVAETAEFLRIPRPTVYYLINKERLPAIRISGRWRVRRSEVETTLHIHPPIDQMRGVKPRVLVVEDELPHQKLYREFLSPDFDIQIAGSASEAMSIARNQRFDLVFLDLQLPDVSGEVVFHQLKELEPDLPVVIVTGYPNTTMLESILATGPVLVLPKPLDFNQLTKASGFLPRVKTDRLILKK